MSKLGNWINKLSNQLGAALEEKPQQSSLSEQVAEQTIGVPMDTSHEEANVAPASEPLRVVKEIESKENLLRSLINTLSNLIEYKDSTNGKKLVLWLDCGQVKYANYDTTSYKNQVLSALVNERGYGFTDVIFHVGRPDENLRADMIGDNELEYIQIVDIEETQVVKNCKAIITIFGDAGSMLKEQYVLSPDDMKKRMITAYNIGAGQFPKVPTGYRENHIAIDDNPDSSMLEKNKYVSRMHAHIGFSDKFGFYLQVELDGTRLMGKRTRIFRGEEKIECDNPQAKVALQSGDLIELGKAVVLRFMLIEE